METSYQKNSAVTPVFSVVMPVFNKELSVNRAICSVLSQSFQQFELIIVDDGSTDQSWLRCQEFTDPRIRLIRQHNQGVSAARNRGAENAVGNYLCFLDADDAYHPDFLNKIYQLVILQPVAALYCCAFQRISASGDLQIFTSKIASCFRGEIDDFFQVYQQNRGFIHTSSAAISRAAFDKVNGFPAGVKIGEDIYLWMRLAICGIVMHDSSIAATVFQDAENRTVHVKSQPLAYHSLQFLSNRDWTKGLSERQIRSVDSFIRHNTLNAAFGALSYGRPVVARGYAKLLRSRYFFLSVLLSFAAFLPAGVYRAIRKLRDASTAKKVARKS